MVDVWVKWFNDVVLFGGKCVFDWMLVGNVGDLVVVC